MDNITACPRSGWAFVVACCKNGKFHYVTSVGGRVILGDHAADNQFVGASEHSAGMGEFSAIMWALKFVFSIADCTSAKCFLFADALTQLRAAQGTAKWSAAQCKLARGMALATEQVVGLEYEHVYAHDWNPWNETADCVAKHMSDNIGPQLSPGPPPFPTEWLENPAVPDWFWMSLLAPADSAAYPL